MKKKYYLAYGSNLNIRQMAWRCPGATVAGTATLDGWRLAFRGSKTGAYLTIVPCQGCSVPVGVWEITDADEKALDRYEGFPHFYYKQTFRVEMQNHLTGKTAVVDALIYIMREDRPQGVPDPSYVQTCVEGCMDFYLDEAALDDALSRARKGVD